MGREVGEEEGEGRKATKGRREEGKEGLYTNIFDKHTWMKT